MKWKQIVDIISVFRPAVRIRVFIAAMKSLAGSVWVFWQTGANLHNRRGSFVCFWATWLEMKVQMFFCGISEWDAFWVLRVLSASYEFVGLLHCLSGNLQTAGCEHKTGV